MTGNDSTPIAKSAIPFLFCLVICIGLITVFTQIVTVVPDALMGVAKQGHPASFEQGMRFSNERSNSPHHRSALAILD